MRFVHGRDKTSSHKPRVTRNLPSRTALNEEPGAARIEVGSQTAVRAQECPNFGDFPDI